MALHYLCQHHQVSLFMAEHGKCNELGRGHRALADVSVAGDRGPRPALSVG